MKPARTGYVSRGDGTIAKTIAFMKRGKRAGQVYAYETLVRSAKTGRLLRVERPGRKPCTP